MGASIKRQPLLTPQNISAVDASRYLGPALHLERGLVKGTWMTFEPVSWCEYLPNVPAYSGEELLHAICIASEGLEKIAKDRADIQVERIDIAEGAYGVVLTVEGGGNVVAKVFGEWERKPFVLEAARLAVEAARHGIGPRIYGYGWLRRTVGRTRASLVLLMEKLSKFQPDTPASSCGCFGERPPKPVAFRTVEEITALLQVWSEKEGFHNDFKVDNILFRGSRPCLIDFDLADPWLIKIAVNSNSFIKFNFRPFFDEVIPKETSATLVAKLRCYYDLFCLTMSIPARHPWLGPIMKELAVLFHVLEEPVFRPFLDTEKWISADARREVPIEVLVRVPDVEAVTVNLFDLRGNGFAHCLPEEEWRSLPQCHKSNGVYWKD